MAVQWFPGHMHKTRKLLKEQIGKMDFVIELRDARIPEASRNPLIGKIVGNKPVLILLNKKDLADPKLTQKWCQALSTGKTKALAVSATDRSIASKILSEGRALVERTGQVPKHRPIKALIVGVPNVGKSTLFNTLAGKTKAKVGNRPAITRDVQRIHLDQGMDLFDTPGVLWPKFEDPQEGYFLAILGSVKDEILLIEEVAVMACEILSKRYPEALAARFKLSELDEDPYELLKSIGRKRGCVQSGGRIDEEKASLILLNDLRAGKLGPITLEDPCTKKL